jgi:hypothetical protein
MFLQNDKILNPLPVPSVCDCCGSANIVFCSNPKDYAHGQDTWCCSDCEASIGCHPNTNTPLGKMANSETRAMRYKAHDVFDLLWKSGLVSRVMAYKWLAAELRIRAKDCHISWFTIEQLEICINASTAFYAERKNAIAGRVKKREAKKLKANRQINKHQEARKRR